MSDPFSCVPPPMSPDAQEGGQEEEEEEEEEQVAHIDDEDDDDDVENRMAADLVNRDLEEKEKEATTAGGVACENVDLEPKEPPSPPAQSDFDDHHIEVESLSTTQVPSDEKVVQHGELKQNDDELESETSHTVEEVKGISETTIKDNQSEEIVTSSKVDSGDDDDDFGDFSEMPTATSTSTTGCTTTVPVSPPNQPQKEEDDQNGIDDGFGDFADFSSSTSTAQKTSNSSFNAKTRYISPSPHLSQLFSSEVRSTVASTSDNNTLLPDNQEFVDDLWTRLNPAAPDHRASPASNSSNSNSSTFGPALSFVWEDAKANQQWMKVLKMDPKNIVFTSSSVMRPTPYVSPQQQLKDFDLNSSKLSGSAYDILLPQQLTPTVVSHGPPRKEERRPHQLSPKARQIIESLPNISFMRSRVLKMPCN